MALYECVISDKDKNKKKFRIELNSEEEIKNYININESIIISMKNIDNKYSKIKIKEKELRVLCKQMAILLESGCEITKILKILKDQSNNKISNILSQISNHIQRGNSITESFQKTKVFSTFFISMIKAGEISGNLDKVMNNLADYYDKEYKVKLKIKNILTYPVIVLILSILSMIIIMTVVIPSFEMILIGNSMNIPLLTKIMISLSRFIRTNYICIIITILFALPILIYSIKNIPKIVKFRNTIKFKVPIIKTIANLVLTTRFCRALSMLVESGVQIVDSIDISSIIIDNQFIYEKLLTSKEYIKKGNSIGYSLELSNTFPKLFISMITIGEESGRLDESLKATESFYSNDLDAKIEETMKLIEPLTIVVLSIIVGIFLISMIMPIFDAIISI